MRQPLTIVAAAIAATAAVAGCNKAKDEANNAVATAIVNHELEKHGAHIDSMNQMQQEMKELAQPLKRPIVGFQKLVPLLPDAPAGWTAEKPDGTTMNTPQMQTTNVSRTYRKGNESLRLQIIDGMSPALAGIAVLASTSEESTNGYRKPYTTGGVIGYEQWSSQSKSGSIMLVTKNRLLIQVDAQGLDGLQPGKDLIAKLDPAKVDAVAQ